MRNRRRIPASDRPMQQNGISRAVVTDHAVLRYLERVHGLDVEYFRSVIADHCLDGVRLGATAVRIDIAKFVLVDGRVVTTLRPFDFADPHHLHRERDG